MIQASAVEAEVVAEHLRKKNFIRLQHPEIIMLRLRFRAHRRVILDPLLDTVSSFILESPDTAEILIRAFLRIPIYLEDP